MAGVTGAIALLTMLAACDPHRGGALPGKASSEWSRSYALPPGGEFQIVGSSGSIDVQGTTNPAIDVKAERIVHAASDSMAESMVSKVRITEDVTTDKIVLRSEGLSGITVGVNVEVNFTVTVPVGTKLRLHSNNGDISVSNIDGALVVSSTNGAVVGRALRGGVDVRSTNGGVTLDLAGMTKDPVDVKATNGAITVSVPPTANANIEATCTNGTLDAGDLPLQLTGEQTKRRMRGRLNDGGAPIELSAVNGNIRLQASGATGVAK
jgi:hypothetical protein